MYCPRCSQPQLPDEVRFCSRCGLHLSAVSELLRTGGMVYNQRKERFPLIKRKELRKGAKFVFGGLFSFIPCLILAGIIDSVLPFAVPFIIAAPFITFLAGLLQIFYYVVFGKSLLPLKEQDRSFALGEHQHRYDLQSGYPFETVSFDTAEFVRPPSITEPTDNLTGYK